MMLHIVQIWIKRVLPLAVLCVLPLAVLCVPLLVAAPVQAQQQNAGAGETKSVDNMSVTTNAIPALKAHDGGLIFNTLGNPVTVTTTGFAAFGAEASAGGRINLDGGGTITTTDNNSFGLFATGTGSTITSIANVTTHGTNAIGAHADTGATITLNGGVITTNGPNAHALAALSGGAITSVADLVTHGSQALGAFTNSNGMITLNGGSVTTTGPAAHGLFIDPTGGTIKSVADVTTMGDGAIGALAGGGMITLNGGTITTTGTASHGLEARETGIVNATGVTITVSGPLSAGMAVVDGGTVTLINSTVTSAQSTVLGSQARTGLTNTISITGSQLNSTTDNAMSIQGGVHNITLQNSMVVGGSGTLLHVQERVVVIPQPDTFPTQLVLNATGSTLVGDMQVLDPGTNTADITLGAGTIWTGASQDITNLTLAGATWNVTGSSTITDTLTNGDAIAFQWSGAFNTITTANYVGNGGTINFNAALAGDASPSDKLIIDGGSAAGTTGVIVTNQGGPGALTTGNGIPLVLPTGGATIGAGTFALAAPAAAGPFQYLLFQGTSSGGGSSAEEQTYYLRSHLGEDTPIFRGEVALYSALASTARQQSLTALGTFHDRNGDQRLAGSAAQRTAAWGRLFGQHTEQDHSGGVAAHFDGNTGGLQAGSDIAQWVSRSGHQDRFGLLAAYARSTGDVGGAVLGLPDTRAGRIELDGTSAGGYWTHLAPSGWYTDAVLMGTRFDADTRSTFGTDASVSGYGFLASLEGGYPIAIARGVWLEPQAQLVYQHINLDDVNDPYAHVGFDTPDALFGRLGLRISADMLPLPMVLRPYLQANIWQDFTDTDTILFSGVHAIHSRHEATTVELGGGVIAQLSSSVGLWVNAGYTTDIGGSDERESVRGTAGLRVVW